MAIGLNTYTWKNNLKSLLLLCAFPFLFYIFIFMLDFIFGYAVVSSSNYQLINQETIFDLNHLTHALNWAGNALIRSWHWITLAILIWFMVAYFLHERILRMGSHSVPLARNQQPKLYNTVENLCISRGLKMPRLFLIESPSLNSFSSGINEDSYSITVTQGLIDNLNEDELEAVLAHEITHIKDNDARFLTIAIIFVGILSFALGFLRILLDNFKIEPNALEDPGNFNSLVFRFIIFILVWLANIPRYISEILFLVVRLAYSQQTEFLADAGSVELTKNPEALATALIKISKAPNLPQVSQELYDMFIISPSNHLLGGGTHPSLEARLEALRLMAGSSVKTFPANVHKPTLGDEPSIVGEVGSYMKDTFVIPKQAKEYNPLSQLVVNITLRRLLYWVGVLVGLMFIGLVFAHLKGAYVGMTLWLGITAIYFLSILILTVFGSWLRVGLAFLDCFILWAILEVIPRQEPIWGDGVITLLMVLAWMFWFTGLIILAKGWKNT
jgi:heat shock protein HtpX